MKKMPVFKKRPEEMRWVLHEERTADFIRFFWCAASFTEQHNWSFLSFIIQAGWTNGNTLKIPETIRRWRNGKLAAYLKCDWEEEDGKLIAAIVSHWPKLNIEEVKKQVASCTGIVNYRRPFRPKLLNYIRKHEKEIAQVFQIVSKTVGKPDGKVAKTMLLLEGLPRISTYNGGTTSILNGITSALACVDPNRVFPIMNDQTSKLLSSIGASRDAEGAMLLLSLIKKNNVLSNLELDVYSQWYADEFPVNRKEVRTHVKVSSSGREIGEKQEEEGYAYLTKGRIKVRRKHNQLINKFRSAILGRYRSVSESDFDVLVSDWKKDKMLLIEAKTATSGSGGRCQLRQAIGQLFDYRHSCFPGAETNIEIALLTPSMPEKDVLSLLESLKIYSLWFSGDKLEGTVKL